MNELYPEISPYNHFFLDVGDDHQLYIEQCGNPKGEPIIFLHGGPGLGCSINDRRFFNPKKYHIVLFDQRGCGHSLPHGSLENIETPILVKDIEKIRTHLDIDKWHVFGGSWGSTLALVYAQTHPMSIISLVLRGVFLGRPEDTQWTFENGGGTRIFADYWQEYLDALPQGVQQSSVKSAHQIIHGTDKVVAKKVALAWAKWELRCGTLEPNEEFAADLADEEKCWIGARHMSHYMIHDCFLTDNQILGNCEKIQHLPIIIVHGRYDIVCPFDNAWLLHQQLPNSELVISRTAGHASIEQETIHHLIDATQKMLNI